MIDFDERPNVNDEVAEDAAEGSSEAGQGLAEYALILVLVAAVCVVALGSLGGAIASSAGFTMF